MTKLQTLEVPIQGMDCSECAQGVQRAIAALPGVQTVNVLLAAEKAVVQLDPAQVDLPAIRQAVVEAGYEVPNTTSQAGPRTLEVPIQGMDCAECAQHVQHAIAALPRVQGVQVLLSAEKALVQLDDMPLDRAVIVRAVEEAGYRVPTSWLADATAAPPAARTTTDFTHQVLLLFGIVFGAVLFVVVVGEGLGLFESLTDLVPWPLGVALVLLAGYPIFRNVVRATLKGQVISHTLMSVGAFAALVVGQWATAAVVVFFMRVGEYAERFTTERARRAVKNLTALAPKTARVERDGVELDLPVGAVQLGDTVVVRPGEQIPVDGTVISGHATIDQAAITGESMPVEAGPGAGVFAATFAQGGSLRVRVTGVGADTTFGRVIRMVEEAETHRADVQRIADKFSAYYLPVVATIAILTFLLRRDPLATAAVLVVACSCSFALATPIAMLASIGAAAKRGLLIKGGKYLETLARADVLLLDKTGTLTLGRPQITDVVALNGVGQNELLALAAATERYSEHPLGEAVRMAARERNLPQYTPQAFVAVPGQGVRAEVNGSTITIGNRRMLPDAVNEPVAAMLEAQGKTLLFVAKDDELAGVLAAADTLRPEIAPALAAVRGVGIKRIEVLTGDNERTASALAERLGVSYQANLLPEDKIAVVKAYQTKGHTVVMVGDGVNDAPALAQADIGFAMGVAGSDVALEAAHVALMRDDWTLVPESLRIARRTMRVVKTNIAFTAVYNLLGLSLAAFGFLPPIWAAAAQSLPDLGILANSSRLLRQRRS
jgi:P-type Cu+ transporter